jgi:adenylate kinase family enzyme
MYPCLAPIEPLIQRKLYLLGKARHDPAERREATETPSDQLQSTRVALARLRHRIEVRRYGGTVPLLSEKVALPNRPTRVVVAGASGSGKTTLAGRIATVLAIPHIEIDSLYHGPQWTPRPSFRDDVADLVAQPSWVTEWQYSSVRPLLTAAADLMVWLDLSRWQVLWQLTVRTVKRRLRRQELWNGNIEPPLWTFFTQPDHIVRWSWRTHPKTTMHITAALAQRPEIPVVRLRSHAAARTWMTGPLAEAVERQPE